MFNLFGTNNTIFHSRYNRWIYINSLMKNSFTNDKPGQSYSEVKDLANNVNYELLLNSLIETRYKENSFNDETISAIKKYIILSKGIIIPLCTFYVFSGICLIPVYIGKSSKLLKLLSGFGIFTLGYYRAFTCLDKLLEQIIELAYPQLTYNQKRAIETGNCGYFLIKDDLSKAV